ncbi:hypothetical protein U1Q18_041040 [Sarracenia purpurea var. burkii]
MESEKTIVVLVILISSVLVVAEGAAGNGLSGCSFPAIYNFGDSNSDTGAFSAAIYPQQPPYGETFFRKPTGRASDGRLLIDFIAKELRLPYLNAYLDSLGTNFQYGANFAVGAGTIRRQNDTQPNGPYICPFYLGVQTTHFANFKARVIDLYKQGKDVNRIPISGDFSKALYTIDIGQNDVARSMFGLSTDEIPDMINQFSTAIKELYNKGARIFWVHNSGPNGCLPSNKLFANRTMDSFDKIGCNNRWNEAVSAFNAQLKERLTKLRADLPQAAITYVDIYAAKYKLISNANKFGFTNPLKQCLHKEKRNRTVVDVSCPNPSKFISWDGVHYTEAANQWLAKAILNGSFSDPPLPITQACHRQAPM